MAIDINNVTAADRKRFAVCYQHSTDRQAVDWSAAATDFDPKVKEASFKTVTLRNMKKLDGQQLSKAKTPDGITEDDINRWALCYIYAKDKQAVDWANAAPAYDPKVKLASFKTVTSRAVAKHVPAGSSPSKKKAGGKRKADDDNENDDEDDEDDTGKKSAKKRAKPAASRKTTTKTSAAKKKAPIKTEAEAEAEAEDDDQELDNEQGMATEGMEDTKDRVADESKPIAEEPSLEAAMNGDEFDDAEDIEKELIEHEIARQIEDELNAATK